MVPTLDLSPFSEVAQALVWSPVVDTMRAFAPRARRFLAFSVLLLPACSGSEELAPAAPDPLETVGGFCQMWAEAACNDDVVDACAAADTPACMDAQSDFCASLISESVYAKDLAEDCLDAVRDAYEDADLAAEELAVVRALGAPCDQLFRGPAQRGDACSDSRDCDTVAGFRCIVKVAGEDGSCEEPVVVTGGRSCERADQVCEEDFYCDGSHCVEKRTEGTACGADVECADTLRCTTDSGAGGAGGAEGSGESRCTPRAGTTEACSADDDCQSRVCARAREASSGVCVRAVRLSVSEPVCEDLR
jgi:hypothetical protein